MIDANKPESNKVGWMRRLLNRIRMLFDPLWIPPEEMERERQEMLERIEMDRKAREGKEGSGHDEDPD